MIKLILDRLETADILTACSILFALVTWLITHAWDRRSKRIGHTADILSALATSDRLSESNFRVTQMINAGMQAPLPGVDDKIEPHVVGMLDYYEFLCDLYAKRIVDRNTVVQLRGRLMRRTRQTCEAYIEETCRLQNRTLYDGFTHFVKKLPPDDSPAFISSGRARRIAYIERWVSRWGRGRRA